MRPSAFTDGNAKWHQVSNTRLVATLDGEVIGDASVSILPNYDRTVVYSTPADGDVFGHAYSVSEACAKVEELTPTPETCDNAE